MHLGILLCVACQSLGNPASAKAEMLEARLTANAVVHARWQLRRIYTVSGASRDIYKCKGEAHAEPGGGAGSAVASPSRNVSNWPARSIKPGVPINKDHFHAVEHDVFCIHARAVGL
jgi:hypothetical protein